MRASKGQTLQYWCLYWSFLILVSWLISTENNSFMIKQNMKTITTGTHYKRQYSAIQIIVVWNPCNVQALFPLFLDSLGLILFQITLVCSGANKRMCPYLSNQFYDQRTTIELRQENYFLQDSPFPHFFYDSGGCTHPCLSISKSIFTPFKKF